MTAALRFPPTRRYSDSFNRALATLQVHGVSAEQAGAVLGLWTRIAALEPREPNITLVEGVKLSWFGDRYYLEVEVLTDCMLTWFFKDSAQAPGVSDGALDPVEELPERFWECLELAGGERG